MCFCKLLKVVVTAAKSLTFALGITCLNLSLSYSAIAETSEDNFRSVIAFMSTDEYERELLVSQKANGEIDEMKVVVVERSPLKTDAYLDVQDIKSDEVDYYIDHPLDGYKVKKVLALPTAVKEDGPMAVEHSALKLDLPFAMQGSDYLIKEWFWPKEHSGMVILVEYENDKWGFIEILENKKTTRTFVRFVEFLSPKPSSTAELKKQLLQNRAWPAAKLIGESHVGSNEFHRNFVRLGQVFDYRDSGLFEDMYEFSDKYKQLHDMFSDSEPSTKVVAEFIKLLKFAKEDDARASEAEGIHNVNAYWAVIHFLSISSKESLHMLWKHFDIEIANLLDVASERFAPEFFKNFIFVLRPNGALMAQTANLFLQLHGPNSEISKQSYEIIAEIHKQWLVQQPSTLFESLKRIDPSLAYLMYLKDVMVKLSYDELDPKLMTYVVDLLSAHMKEPHVIEALNHIKSRHKDFWAMSVSIGKPHFSSNCANILSKL